MMVSSTAHAFRGQDEDWYKVLGVERSADSKVIRAAYRKLVLKWHPDKNPGKEAEAGKQTSRINNAYEIAKKAERLRKEKAEAEKKEKEDKERLKKEKEYLDWKLNAEKEDAERLRKKAERLRKEKYYR
jgi:curved DNA-binding protein CbpA